MNINSKPTSGAWVVNGEAGDDWEMPIHEGRTSSSCQYITDDTGEVIAFAVTSYDAWDDPYQEAKMDANAKLIAEAGTVYNETGLSPRELLELLQAIIDAGDSPEADGGEMWYAEAVSGPIEKAKIALNKHKGGLIWTQKLNLR